MPEEKYHCFTSTDGVLCFCCLLRTWVQGFVLKKRCYNLFFIIYCWLNYISPVLFFLVVKTFFVWLNVYLLSFEGFVLKCCSVSF